MNSRYSAYKPGESRQLLEFVGSLVPFQIKFSKLVVMWMLDCWVAVYNHVRAVASETLIIRQ